MVKNCWMNLTPLQLACVLILIVAIPFFIAMLVIYLMYGVIWHKSEQCQNLCAYEKENLLNAEPGDEIPIDEQTKKDILEPTTASPPQETSTPTTPTQRRPPPLPGSIGDELIPPEKRRPRPRPGRPKRLSERREEIKEETQIPQLFCPSKPSSRLQEQGKQEDSRRKQNVLEPLINDNTKVPNVPVAALLDKLHVDDTSYYFKCSAVVIADGWALSVTRCAETGISAIRFGSSYWSQGGIFRKVNEVLYPKGTNSLALIGFTRSGVTGASVGRFWETKKVLSYNWRSNLHLPLAERKKYDPLEISEMEPRRNLSCSNSKGKEVLCYMMDKSGCDRDVNAPMFSENLQLVGFHLETLCPENTNSSIVVYVNI